MDQRQIFHNNNELLSFVKSISVQEVKATLLIDKAGLSRVERFITSIKRPESYLEKLTKGRKSTSQQINYLFFAYSFQENAYAFGLGLILY